MSLEENINDINDNKSIDALQIIINNLKMYDLSRVDVLNLHKELANEIFNDLVSARFIR